MGAHSWLITLPEHDSSPGSVCCCEPSSPTPKSQLTVLQHWQKLCYNLGCSSQLYSSGQIVWASTGGNNDHSMQCQIPMMWVFGMGSLMSDWEKSMETAWGRLGFLICTCTVPISRVFWVAPLCYLIHSNNIHGCTYVAGTPSKEGTIAVFYWFLLDVKWETLFLHSLPRLVKTFCLHFLIGVKIRCTLGSPEMKVH